MVTSRRFGDQFELDRFGSRRRRWLIYAGLDVPKAETTICVRDDDGQIVLQTKVASESGVFHFIAVLLDLILTGGKSRVAAKRRRIRQASPTGRGVRLSYDTFWRFLRLSRVHSASTFDNTAWSE